MKRSLSFLLIIFGLTFISNEIYAQERDVGKWVKSFDENKDGSIGEVFYAQFLQGKIFDINTKGYKNERVKLLIRVDKAVIDGFALAVIDKNNHFVHLGNNTTLNITVDWETDVNIALDEIRRDGVNCACIVKSAPHLNNLADYLCQGYCTIVIGTNDKYGEPQLYVFEIQDETHGLDAAVDDLLEFYDMIEETLRLNEMFLH